VKELPDMVGNLLANRAEHQKAIKEISAAVDMVDAAVMEALGDAEVGTINGQKVVTWKGSTRNSIDTKALKEAHPALAVEFMKATEVRTLRYSATKEEL
jgi:predicted phage-related endonuclease